MNFFCYYKRFSIYTIWVILSILSCEKEIDYPAFGSMTLSSISNSAFLASIDVKSTGEFGVLDHGFYYILSTSDPGSSYLGVYKKSLGSSIEGDTISTVLVPDVSSYYYNDNLKMFARAYITDSRGTVYSDYVSTPVLKFTALNISPSFAGAGDTITITGSNFNTDVYLNSVSFNNVYGEIVSATSQSIKVIVPAGVQYDYYWSSYIIVRVRSGNQTAELNSVFRLEPSPESFSPASGSWDQMITIHGSGMYNCTVYLNSQEIGISGNNSSTVYFYVPAEFHSKKFKIYLKNSGITYEVPGGYFTMKDMDLSISGNRYYPGQIITVNGTGFNPNSTFNKLFLGNTKINCEYTYSYMQFRIPGQTPAGSYPVRVSNSVDTASLDEISVIRPVISELSEILGYPGTEITLTGTDLVNEGQYPYLNLGPYSFSPRQYSASGIEFIVPFIPAGEYNLSASYGEFAVDAPEKFTVLEPVVNSIVPDEGAPGTSVVINGEGFVNSYNSYVHFGNINAPIMSLNETQINVRVPDSLSSGVWMVQVFINGQQLSTTVNFTVQ